MILFNITGVFTIPLNSLYSKYEDVTCRAPDAVGSSNRVHSVSYGRLLGFILESKGPSPQIRQVGPCLTEGDSSSRVGVCEVMP